MDGYPFWKMSGSGNDFIFMDHREVPWKEWDLPEVARRLCRRRLSVGADGLAVLIPPRDPRHDFAWRFFNADGSEAEMCGNASRCAARFALSKGLAGPVMRFETLAGPIDAEVRGQRALVGMGAPTEIRPEVAVTASGRAVSLVAVHTGVPHVVEFVEDVDAVDVVGMGRAIRHHEAFAPRGTNVNFAQVVDGRTLKVRTYERGVEDETLACGTGAAAAALAAHMGGRVSAPVSVMVRSGRVLGIHFETLGEGYGPVRLEGDAMLIYEGVVRQDALAD
jgi:diaminopimelate epimerase